MTVRYKASAMFLSALTLISFLYLAPVWADQGEIKSVQVAQDLSSISIYSQGPIGKHSAFVIDKPYRLVIDFDSATIGNTKARIRVAHPPITEIRLGYHNNRARVVVDFGENPVPPYRIERKEDVVVLTFGRTAALTAGQVQPKPEPAPRKQVPRPPDRTMQTQKPVSPAESESTTAGPQTSASAPEVSRSETADNDEAPILVKNAGVKSNLVYVELVNKTDPRISYRLIVDLDLEALKMRSASLSDAKGNIRKFHVTRSETEKLNSTPRGNRFTSGPKRYWPSGLTASAPTFSETSVEETGAERGQKAAKSPQSGWPVRIEVFQPQPKNTVR